ncbi:unnamed protein product (macronuclear) [Paramecium tetraurelia]|uniref:Uncharacterized protein n=1 Tax=Paramecium tetraurelia TaxID=5888 RepID=A0E609_PARTE|nr:uncharacterized protein GSPATT00003589001 [Paramecium tetraurelia]CAK90726.1 unnamed protein product [Paramecium tetraurelia]|eukprot:XP_001458123.1 hypothetical protein (macronuclear) [Paramecium tetraurelia strain d4-2]
MPLDQFIQEVSQVFNIQIGTFYVISQDKRIEIRNTEELYWYGQSGGILITEKQTFQNRIYTPIPNLNLSQIQNQKQYSIVRKTQEIKKRLNQTIKLMKETQSTVTYRSLSPKESWKCLQEKTKQLQEQTQQFNSRKEELQQESEKQAIHYYKSLLKEILEVQNEYVMYSKRNDGLQKSINQLQMLLKLQKKQINQIKMRYPAIDLDSYVSSIKYQSNLKDTLLNYLQVLLQMILKGEDKNNFKTSFNQNETIFCLQQIIKEIKKI